MKHVSLFALLAILMCGCFSYRELPVEYDYSYRGRFDKYNSYDFINQEENRSGYRVQPK